MSKTYVLKYPIIGIQDAFDDLKKIIEESPDESYLTDFRVTASGENDYDVRIEVVSETDNLPYPDPDVKRFTEWVESI